MKDGKRIAPTLHISTDMGPVGAYAVQYLLCRLGARATCAWDLLHRLQSNLHRAQQAAGLNLVRFSMQVVLNIRKGPFAPGGANCWLLKEAAQEFFQTCTSSNALFQLLYSDLAACAGIRDAEYGSPTHEQKLWAWCQHQLLEKAGESDEVKLSRWWSFEIRSRQGHARWAVDLMLLLWVGMQRRWWRTPGACPLYRTVDAPPEVPEDAALLPGEAVAAAPAAAGDGAAAADEGERRPTRAV